MEQHPRTITIGSVDGEHVTIRVGDSIEEGWLGAVVDLRVNGFIGQGNGVLTIKDLPALRDDLKKLYEELEGEVVFTTIENWIELRFVGVGTGGISVSGRLHNAEGSRNTLTFELPSMDQSHLPTLIRAIDAAIASIVVKSSGWM